MGLISREIGLWMLQGYIVRNLLVYPAMFNYAKGVDYSDMHKVLKPLAILVDKILLAKMAIPQLLKGTVPQLIPVVWILEVVNVWDHFKEFTEIIYSRNPELPPDAKP